MCLNPQLVHPVFKGGEYTYQFGPGDWSADGLINPETGEFLSGFQVPCGRCLECIQQHKLDWTYRLLDEAGLYSDNMFLTLTYADAPACGVVKADFQKFIKRLRARIDPVKIRYFGCGEYGSKGRRPHYHIVIFGYRFPDLVYFRRDKKGFSMFRSKILEELWSFGYSSVCDVSDVTLSYVTKDLQKLLPLQDGRNPPFVLMSLKPGIGIAGVNKKCVETGFLYRSGHYKSLPRYYLDKLSEDYPEEIRQIRLNRLQRALDYEPATPEQLIARREKIKNKIKSRLDKLF